MPAHPPSSVYPPHPLQSPPNQKIPQMPHSRSSPGPALPLPRLIRPRYIAPTLPHRMAHHPVPPTTCPVSASSTLTLVVSPSTLPQTNTLQMTPTASCHGLTLQNTHVGCSVPYLAGVLHNALIRSLPSSRHTLPSSQPRAAAPKSPIKSPLRKVRPYWVFSPSSPAARHCPHGWLTFIHRQLFSRLIYPC